MTKRHLIACVKEGRIMFVVEKLVQGLELKTGLRDEFYTVITTSSMLKRSGKDRRTGVITRDTLQSIISQAELTILKVIDDLPEEIEY